MADRLCVLAVHAHPDDEASKGAGSIARYHAEGVRTVLVTCTGGEEGEILNPALDTPEARANIASLRALELERAAAIIGYEVVVLLGYRDSGMAGSPANDDPRSFAQAPFDEATARLVSVIRRERPQVLVTYDEDQSRYPHPDHLRVHDISVAAFEAAGDASRFEDAGEAFQPLKLYYVGWSRGWALARHQKFLELGLVSPYAERVNEEWWSRPAKATTLVDLRGFETVRRRALLAHETQVDPTSPFWFGLSEEAEIGLFPYDEYVLARSLVGPADDEDDLFRGVREQAEEARRRA